MIAGRSVRETFGTMPDGRGVEMHTVRNARGTELCFLNLGGIIQAFRVRDRDGAVVDVTPGYDSLYGYLDDSRYFGALVGRYANRIAGGRFVLDDHAYTLSINNGANHLHGGDNGFASALWDVEPFQGRTTAGAVLSLVSPDGESGYPGTLSVRVTYTLSDDDELRFDYFATTDAPTPVNLTQHTYFNLAGHDVGDVLGHELTLNASHYTPVDDALIPTGKKLPVKHTPFDFSRPRAIGACIDSLDVQLQRAAGYDHNFVIDDVAPGALTWAATVGEPRSGRTLRIETTEPGIQFYSGNHIAGGPLGKHGCDYGRHSSLALETQHFPNSPNEPSFPSTILRPGMEYQSTTLYRFNT